MGVFLAELDLFVAEHKKLAAGAGGGGEDADDDEKSALRQDLETQSRLIGKLQEDLKAADGKVAALTETATNLRAALRTTNALEDDGSGPGKGGFGGYADAALRVAGDQVLAFLILAPTPANVSLKAGAAVTKLFEAHVCRGRTFVNEYEVLKPRAVVACKHIDIEALELRLETKGPGQDFEILKHEEEFATEMFALCLLVQLGDLNTLRILDWLFIRVRNVTFLRPFKKESLERQADQSQQGRVSLDLGQLRTCSLGSAISLGFSFAPPAPPGARVPPSILGSELGPNDSASRER